MVRLLGFSALLLVVSGSQLPAEGAATKGDRSIDRRARGMMFAQQRCSGCHGVIANGLSIDPEAPPFDEIANRPGLTRLTLQQFLSNSHNYPAAMGFRVQASQAADLSEYIFALKKPGYRPIM